MDNDQTLGATNAETENFVGLSPEDNGLLDTCLEDETAVNLPPEERWERSMKLTQELAVELRKKYKNDPLALEEIDMYDHTALYHILFNKQQAAEKAGDMGLANEISKEMKAKYPLLHAKGIIIS